MTAGYLIVLEPDISIVHGSPSLETVPQSQDDSHY